MPQSRQNGSRCPPIQQLRGAETGKQQESGIYFCANPESVEDMVTELPSLYGAIPRQVRVEVVVFEPLRSGF